MDIARGKLPGRTPGVNNFVDVRDVARGMIAVAEKGKTGERYILGGDNIAYGDIFDVISDAAGVKRLSWNIPRALAAPVGWFGDMREALGGEPLINSVTVGFGYCPSFIFTSAKAERELGYAHGPVAKAIADAIGWFREVGMMPRAHGITDR